MALVDEILPGLPTEHESWERLLLSDLTAGVLAPYQIITGIGAVNDFNQIEQTVCDKLAPLGYDLVRGGILGATIARRRLADEVRPEGFYGRLTNASAMIFPFDVARAKKYRGAVYMPADIPPEAGATLLITGQTHSSGSRSHGLLLTEATYYDREYRNPHYTQQQDRLRRIIAGRRITRTAELQINEDHANAAARAYRIARYALQHLYHG